MSEFNEKLEELRASLFEQEEVKAYFALKQAIESDVSLMKANELMRFHQKEMAKNLHRPDVYAKEKALFETYSKEYQNHPLVVNYEASKAAVYALLKQIKDILEK